MRNTAIFLTINFGGALVFGSSNTMAQSIALEYNTEWQTDFKGSYDWLNLLTTSAELPLSKAVTLEAATLSIAKCGDEPLIDDLLTYSNIEAGNIPLTVSRLGIGINVRQASWFVGINNVNTDYFTSDLTSLFTNSSCGISPTLSCNYDIANYPLSSWCVHYRQQLGDVSIQSSLYPGQGYYRLAGHANIFSLDIKRDGIFSISSIDYKRNGIYCILGVALHHGVCMGDADAEPIEAQEPQKKLSAAPWLLSEISVPGGFGILAHASLSTVKNGCKNYAGIGIVYNEHPLSPGISFNHATFSSLNESDLEITARVPILSGKATLQPALHIITTDYANARCIGILRLIL